MVNKRFLSGFIAICILFTVVFGGIPSTVVNAAPANLLANPGFESGTTAPWTEGSRATNNPHSGSGHGSLSKSQTQQYQVVNIPVTGYYDLSAWVTSQKTSGITLGVRKANGVTDIKSSSLVPSASVYNFYQVRDIFLNKGDSVQVYLKNTSSGWVNHDDFSLTLNTSQVVNLAANPDFENGQNCWTTSGAAITVANVHSGLNAMELQAGSDNIVSQAVTVPMPGSYKLSAWVSAGVTGSAIGIKNDDGTLITSEAIPAGNVYQQITTPDISLNEGDTVVVYTSGGNSWVRVDDVDFSLDLSGTPNNPPVASELSISGLIRIGQYVTGSYSFSDPDAGSWEGASTYRWLMADSIDGDYQPIAGETKIALTIPANAWNKYIKFEVIPQDMYGLNGTPIQSSGYLVDRNWIQNPGYELNGNNWVFTGTAAVANRATTTLVPLAVPRNGNLLARIPAGSGNSAYQNITVDTTGDYSLSVYSINAAGGELGIIDVQSGKVIANTPMQDSSLAVDGYVQQKLTNIVLRENQKVQVYVKGGTNPVPMDVDDFELLRTGAVTGAYFNTFSVANEQKPADVDWINKTVTFYVASDAEITSVAPEFTLTAGTSSIASGTANDFTQPVKYVLSDGATQVEWTVSCVKMSPDITINSSNTKLVNAFNWAKVMARSWVQTGKQTNYIPSYWAGYPHRPAFYSRDFAHQALGAHLLGLDQENFSMLQAFAKSSNLARKWYPLWALQFDGTTYGVDWKSDTNFVREVPAVFELVETGYKQYLWSGDSRYVNDVDLSNYYAKAMNDFITLHDGETGENGIAANSVAEGYSAASIWTGVASYNELSSEKLIEAGDGIAAQYQGLLSYAAIQKAGNDPGYADTLKRAQELKAYFNDTWSQPVNPSDLYVRGYNVTGNKYVGFGKENSWFMPMKLITEAGSRNSSYLDFIDQQASTTDKSNPSYISNIEARTYLPDTFFPYNRADLGWKWMERNIDSLNDTHPVSGVGVNGNYPEVSYTLISQTVSGLMGIEADAPGKKVSTVSRLPQAISWLEIKRIPVGSAKIDVKHLGQTKTTFKNAAGTDALIWEAEFYGNYPTIMVNGSSQPSSQKTINGVPTSYVTIEVPAGGTATAEVTAAVNKSALFAAIGTAQEKVESNYTAASWAALQTALSSAIAVNTNESATQAEVDAAVAALNAAISGLVPTVPAADKTALGAAIITAQGKLQSDYTAASWAVLQAALSSAIAVNTNANAVQAEVDAAVEALNTAISRLVSVTKSVTLNAIGDKKPGEIVTISGTTTLSEIAVIVKLPDNTVLYYNDGIKGSNFSDSFTLPGNAVEGMYTVMAGVGADYAVVTFNVVKGQTPSVDKAALLAAISTAQGKVQSNYTAASWAILQTALNSAVAVNADVNAVQTAVDAALAALNAAIAGLEQVKPNVPVTGITVKGQDNMTSIATRGGTLQMSAVILPSDASNKNVVWSVVNGTGRAVISSTGLLTATADGTVTVKAAALDGSGVVGTCAITITGQYTPPPTYTPSPTYTPPITDTSHNPATPKNGIIVLEKPKVDAATGIAKTAPVREEDLKKALETAAVDGDGIRTAKVEVPKAEGAKTYIVELPKSALASGEAKQRVEVSTEISTIVAPSNMLTAYDTANIKNVALSISIADTAKLDKGLQEKIGNRPVIELSLQLDGRTIEWNNQDAPVIISIPYEATKEELANQEYLVIWYIDGNGNAISIPSGKYNHVNKVVTFTTTHFSKYVIAFVKMTFDDMDKSHWATTPVQILASKGVIEGTGDRYFSPKKNITRGEFIMWLVKALGLTAGFDSNFEDVRKTDAYYDTVGIAKKLGITAGVGKNRFSPEKQISRQDMMVLINRALKVANRELDAGSKTDLEMFSDYSKVADYAVKDIATLFKSGLIAGSGKNMLNPAGTATRAEVATVLYKIYSK